MQKIKSLQAVKDAIRNAVMTDNIVKQSNGSDKPLYNALAMVPESEIWRHVCWMHEYLLPKIAQSRGVDSEEYKNYKSIRDALIWAMYISQQYERVLVLRGSDKQKLDFYIQHAGYLERELAKYQTAEQMFSASAFTAFRDSLVSKALALMDEKPG